MTGTDNGLEFIIAAIGWGAALLVIGWLGQLLIERVAWAVERWLRQWRDRERSRAWRGIGGEW